MGRLAQVDDAAGAARYIGNYLNTQSYHVHKYINERLLGVPRLDRILTMV